MSFKLFFLLLLTSNLYAQDSLRLSKTIPVMAEYIAVDNLENIYVVTPSNDILKYDKTGELKYTQNFKLYGKPTSFDVSNLMEIYVFYREANTVLYLDNTLSERGITDFTTGRFGLVTAVARSYDNGLWVWDQADLQLKKSTKEQQNIISSGNPLVLGTGTITPYLIADNGSNVILVDSNGIIVCDVFANFIRSIKIKKPGIVQLLGQKLYYVSSTQLFMIDIKTFEQKMVYRFNQLPDLAVVAGKRIYTVVKGSGKIEIWE